MVFRPKIPKTYTKKLFLIYRAIVINTAEDCCEMEYHKIQNLIGFVIVWKLCANGSLPSYVLWGQTAAHLGHALLQNMLRGM